jgi:hypothetical protein
MAGRRWEDGWQDGWQDRRQDGWQDRRQDGWQDRRQDGWQGGWLAIADDGGWRGGCLAAVVESQGGSPQDARKLTRRQHDGFKAQELA